MIWWAVFLFLGGVVLIYAEFILPGAVCGITGGLLLIGSGMIAVNAYPEWTVAILFIEIFGAFAAVLLGLRMISRGATGKALRHEATQDADQGWVSAPTDAGLMGAEGIVFSALRPAGAIEVGGRRIDAVADGAFIDKGRRVRVIDVHGSRVVVEAIPEQ